MPYLLPSSSTPTWYLLLLFTCLTSLAKTNTSPARRFEINSSDALEIATPIGNEALAVSSSSLSVTLPPADFTFDTSVGSVTLSKEGIFLLTISALVSLGRLRFNDRSPAAKIFRFPAAPGIVLGMSGLGLGGGFDVRHMVWGATLAFKHMVDRSQFRNWRFTLRWHSNAVGTLWYIYETPRGGIASNETLALMGVQQTGVALKESRIDTETVNIRFHVREVPGDLLALNEVMVVIVSGFTDIAFHDSRQPVDGHRFETKFPPYRGKLYLESILRPPMTHDWLTNEVVRTTLKQLTAWYLPRQIYKPLQIMVYMNGLHVGMGSMNR